MSDPTGTAVRAARRLRVLSSPARTLLAALLLGMAAGQLSDLGGFARVLGGFRILPGWLQTPAAWALAGAEAVAGLDLLRNRRRGGLLALVIASVWSALAFQAFVPGIAVDNCGCFGVHLSQPLRWWVLLEDAEFVALAAWVRRAERSSGTSWPDRPGNQME